MKLNTVIAYTLQGLLLVLFVWELIQKQYLYAIVGALAVIVSLLPAWFARNYRITLPWIVESLIAFGLLLHVSGLTFRWYVTFPWWDIAVHLIGTGIIALLGFLFIFALYYSERIKVTLRMMGFFAFIFAIAIGALWEIAEFATDKTVGSKSQPDLDDTMYDLINDTIAAAIVSLLGCWYVKHQPENKLRTHVGHMVPWMRERHS